MTKNLRVGIIGANLQGSWGVGAHLPALAQLDGFEAIAVATQHIESAQASADAFGVPLAFGDPMELVRHPDVDIVAVCVRVPAHRELVLAAIAAGKHVYCEWPLGRDAAEAREMLAAAEKAGIVHMVGLQSRSSPVLGYVRGLIEQGEIGTVRSVSMTHSSDWLTAPFPSITYLQDRSSGAHFLSIPGGHSLDALTYVLGDFKSLSAVVKTSLKDLEVQFTGEKMTRTSADQIVVIGELENGAVANVRLSGASSLGTGVRLEISGDKGDLVVIAQGDARGIQMSDLKLFKTTGMGVLTEVEVPESAYHVPEAVRVSPPLNVAEAYLHMADAIAGKSKATPDFADAIKHHELLDRIEESSRKGVRI